MLYTATDGADTDESPPGRTKRPVLTSAALLGGATVLVKLVAFAKDWLVAKRFGADDELDAFLVAFLIPSFAVAVLANSFASAWVPGFIRVWEQQGRASARRLVANVLGIGLVVLISTTLLLAATSSWVLPWVGTGFDPEKLALTQKLLYVLAGMLVLNGISCIFAGVLNSLEYFTLPAAAPLMIPLASVVVFWLGQNRFGIYALAAGTLIGCALECSLLAAAMYRHGLLPWPQWDGMNRTLSHLGSQYLAVAAGALLMNSSTVIDQSMAASLGSGNVSILAYANKIPALVLTMVAVSLSTVLFPRFSRMITRGRWHEVKQMTRYFVKLILIGSVPVMIVLALLSEVLVRLLFERGAFTPETTAAVTRVQLCFILQFPFYVLAMLGARLLSALDANHALLRISALNLALNILGNYVFMHWYGVAGIAISTSLVYFAASLAILGTIRYRLNEVSMRDA